MRRWPSFRSRRSGPVRKTKPGSRAHRIVELVREGAERLARGLELEEIREAWREAEGTEPPKTLTSEVSSLKRRGVLKAAGGRAGHTLYAPADMTGIDRQRADDDAVIVLEALRRGHRRLDRALSTREVAEEIEAEERALSTDHPNAVKKYLDTLARETVRGPKASRAPKVVRISAEGAAGQPSNHWLPAGAAPDESEELEALVAPRSKADAVRQAVGRAAKDLARPVSRTELRWWLEWTGAPPVLRKALTAARAGTCLSDTYRTDRHHAGEEGRLHQVTTQLTCHGGAPVRWSLGPATAWQEALCRVEDVAGAFRLPEELQSIQALERLAALLRSDVLSGLADLRRRLVMARLRDAAGEFEGRALAQDLLATGERMERWLGEGDDLTSGQRETRTYALRDRRELLGAAEGLLRFDGYMEAPEVRAVGEAGLVSLEDLQPPLESAARTIGLPSEDGQGLIAKARRFPVEEAPGRERFENPLANPLSLVDRLDAVEALYELVPAVRARSLVRDVRALLGYSLRDAEVVRAFLSEVGDRPGFPREALVVALGVAGSRAMRPEVLSAGAGEAHVAALVLAHVLNDPSDALSLVGRRPDTRRRPGWPRAATRRIQAGYLLSAIE